MQLLYPNSAAAKTVLMLKARSVCDARVVLLCYNHALSEFIQE